MAHLGRWAALPWLAVLFMSMALVGAGSMGSSGGQHQAGCRLTIMGSGQGRFQQAALSCAGTQATVALNSNSLGAYQANFKGIKLVKSCGSQAAEAFPCLITICSGTVVLRDSRVSGVQDSILGCVLCVAGSSRLEVYGSQLSNNQVRPLAAVDQATVVLHASAIADNTVPGRGGGLWVEGEARVTITAGSKVHGNKARSSGGLRVAGNADVAISGGSSVSNNTCGEWGGGLEAWESAAVLITGASSVRGNTATNGSAGGVFVGESASVTLSDGSSVHDNTAAGGGGGVTAQDDAKLTILDSSVHGNRALQKNGGGVAAQGRCLVTITNSSVHDNSAPQSNGGGLFLQDNASVAVTNGRVHGNTAGRGGGGVFVQANSTLAVSNSSVRGNKAQHNGGGLNMMDDTMVDISSSSVQGNTAGWGGGGVFAQDTVLTISNSQVRDNVASRNGGGVALMDAATLDITPGTVVANNTAWEGGGGVCAEKNSTVTINGSSVHGNTANFSGGGVSVQGAASMLIVDSSVQGNVANRAGGGVWAQESADVVIANTSVVGNVAATGGGGLDVIDDVSVAITNHSLVSNNRVSKGAGGGLEVSGFASLAISGGCVIANNTCRGVGGGLSVGYSPNLKFGAMGRRERDESADSDDVVSTAHASINSSIIANNTSNGSPGGGLAVTAKSVVKLLEGTRVSGNKAINGSAGAVLVSDRALLHADDSVKFAQNGGALRFVGGSIAVWDSADVSLPARVSQPDQLTKCNAGVYLGRTPCGAGETLLHDVCVCCPPHTFGFNNQIESCMPCPPNADCPGANVVAPMPGFWSSAPTSVQMHRCPLFKTACDYVNRTSMCKPGYQGPLCGTCQLPEYGMLSPMRCSRCMRPSVQLGLYLLCGSLMVVFVACTVHTTWQENVAGTRGIQVTDVVKVLVLHLQYLVIIGSCSVPWPLFDVQQWLQAVDVFVTLGSGQAFSLDCWLRNYFPHSKLPIAIQRHLVYFLAPLCTLAAVVALQWAAGAVHRWLVTKKASSWQPKESTDAQQASSPTGSQGYLLLLRKLPVTCLVLVYYAYPTLLRASLSFFACLDIDRPVTASEAAQGITAPLSHKWGYWVSSVDAKCFAGWHLGWSMGLGLPMVLLWCVGVPVAMGLGLFLGRHKADDETFREHFGFLYRTYRPERMWWEAVWASRTVVLTLISVFAFPMQRYFSVLSLLLVFFVSAALQLVCKPYEEPALHRMHLVSTSSLAVTTMGALAMFAYDIQESTAFGLRIAITALVFSLNLAFVVWCCIKLAPGLKEWAVTKYASAKVWVPEVVEGAMECVGQPPRRRQRRPPRFRGV